MKNTLQEERDVTNVTEMDILQNAAKVRKSIMTRNPEEVNIQLILSRQK